MTKRKPNKRERFRFQELLNDLKIYLDGNRIKEQNLLADYNYIFHKIHVYCLASLVNSCSKKMKELTNVLQNIKVST